MIYNAEKGVMKSNIRQVIGGRGFFLKRAFNDRGYVALFIASYRGHANIVSKLMALGINACRKMPSGRSAIQVAIFKKRINCVNALVGKLSHPINPSDSHKSHGYYNFNPSVNSQNLSGKIIMQSKLKVKKEKEESCCIFW